MFARHHFGSHLVWIRMNIQSTTVFAILGLLLFARILSQENRWTLDGVASGVYFCEMRAEGFSKSMKMIYQK
jgi:hypothetical protein